MQRPLDSRTGHPFVVQAFSSFSNYWLLSKLSTDTHISHHVITGRLERRTPSAWHSLSQDACAHTFTSLFSQALYPGRANNSSNNFTGRQHLTVYEALLPMSFYFLSHTLMMREGKWSTFQVTSGETKVQGEVPAQGHATAGGKTGARNACLRTDAYMSLPPATCIQAPVLSSQSPSSLHSEQHLERLSSAAFVSSLSQSFSLLSTLPCAPFLASFQFSLNLANDSDQPQSN